MNSRTELYLARAREARAMAHRADPALRGDFLRVAIQLEMLAQEIAGTDSAAEERVRSALSRRPN